MKRFYFIRNCYSASIEGSGINLRIGYTCMGIRLKPQKYYWGRAIDAPMWVKLFVPLSVGLNYHSGQSNRMFRFHLELGCLRLWYLTKGERAEKGYTGLHAAFYYPFKDFRKASNNPIF